MTLRWFSAIKIQQIWRGKLARLRIQRQLAAKAETVQNHFQEADRHEAALLIQTQMRRFLAVKRVEILYHEQCIADEHAELLRLQQLETLITIPEEYLKFSLKPTQEELRRLFDAIDTPQQRFIDRAYCDLLFPLLSPYVPLVASSPQQRQYHGDTSPTTVSVDDPSGGAAVVEESEPLCPEYIHREVTKLLSGSAGLRYGGCRNIEEARHNQVAEELYGPSIDDVRLLEEVGMKTKSMPGQPPTATAAATHHRYSRAATTSPLSDTTSTSTDSLAQRLLRIIRRQEEILESVGFHVKSETATTSHRISGPSSSPTKYGIPKIPLEQAMKKKAATPSETLQQSNTSSAAKGTKGKSSATPSSNATPVSGAPGASETPQRRSAGRVSGSKVSPGQQRRKGSTSTKKPQTVAEVLRYVESLNSANYTMSPLGPAAVSPYERPLSPELLAAAPNSSFGKKPPNFRINVAGLSGQGFAGKSPGSARFRTGTSARGGAIVFSGRRPVVSQSQRLAQRSRQKKLETSTRAQQDRTWESSTVAELNQLQQQNQLKQQNHAFQPHYTSTSSSLRSSQENRLSSKSAPGPSRRSSQQSSGRVEAPSKPSVGVTSSTGYRSSAPLATRATTAGTQTRPPGSVGYKRAGPPPPSSASGLGLAGTTQAPYVAPSVLPGGRKPPKLVRPTYTAPSTTVSGRTL